MLNLDRTAVILRPTQALVDWANDVDDSGHVVGLEVARRDCTAYLIPAFDFPEDARAFVEGRHEELLEIVLAGYYTDESLWPKPLDVALFRRFFDVEVHTEVLAEPW